ncbi:agamous-like MADS-box protein AGL61 [Ipomoea triloba]|uniref:agamous-like MADS-box protein AGL61 n=1 Tax=Ipomoea triloba TaxID=35885 RepID=UPI00125D7003|nr:agamous-like MADS-box protein AGL61 [Ipomoea triloba]
MVTFSKRRTGLFKKAVELEDKTGARVAMVVFSPRDTPYTYGDIPAMSDLLDKITNNNNAVVPYGAEQMQEDNAAVAATPSSNYKNIMRWVDSIDVDGFVLSWFPFVSEFQTRLLFNQAFSRGLQISMILAGKKASANV